LSEWEIRGGFVFDLADGGAIFVFFDLGGRFESVSIVRVGSCFEVLGVDWDERGLFEGGVI
jgi:hypothetical protein